MKRFILAISLVILSANISFSQSSQQEAINRICSNSSYKWGMANSTSQDEAREKAYEDLVAKLKTVLVSQSKLSNDEFANDITAVTVGAIEDVDEILYQDEKKNWVCLKYVSEERLRQADEERRNLIVEMVRIGQQQEGEVNISEALKYYNWALRMLNVYQDKIDVDTPKGRKDAKVWLMSHIPAVLDNIKFSIQPGSIYENPNDYDRYQVTVKAYYDGHPVSLLDISYFNGETSVSPVHFKSGEGVVSFHDIASLKSLDLNVLYEYAKEGRNFSEFLAAAYPKRFSQMPFTDRASFKVPLDKALLAQSGDPGASQTVVSVQTAPSTDSQSDDSPIYKEPKKAIARVAIDNPDKYFSLMRRVENALRSRDYESVRDCFTDEGFRIFEMMTGSGIISVSRASIDYKVESSNLCIVGKSIPVSIKNGKHLSKENIVFRFDPLQDKIKSVAYALTERAENDIFRESQWTLDSRYALLQFMEDYQTAYSLKRLDYIESIFSDNAIIIVGSVSAKPAKRFYGASDMTVKSLPNVTYTKYDKDSYLQKLKEDFRKKSFIQLVFEETTISKVGGTEGFTDNEVMWIELKQNYYSSNYSDKGYLALQIDLKPKGSMINVRTWTPYFVPIDELKKSFPIGF